MATDGKNTRTVEQGNDDIERLRPARRARREIIAERRKREPVAAADPIDEGTAALQELVPEWTREDTLKKVAKWKLDAERKRLNPDTLPEILARVVDLLSRAPTAKLAEENAIRGRKAREVDEDRRTAMAPGFELALSVIRDLQNAVLLDNGGKGFALQEDSVNLIPHRHGRARKGWFLASLVAPALLGSSPNVWEFDPGDGAFIADLSKSHLQLWTDAACAVKVVVF